MTNIQNNLVILALKSYIKKKLKFLKEYVLELSVMKALRQQGFISVYELLCQSVSDLNDQYTSFKLDTSYLKSKVRGMHAFQISLIGHAISLLNKDELKNSEVTIVDIGDSSGTHIQYLKEIYKAENYRYLSVNLDAEAVKRIKEKNLEAVCERAEDLVKLGVDATIFLSFETIEHLLDPICFLHSISEKTNCKYFVLTIPYVRKTRMGLNYIRTKNINKTSPESVHIFEFAPEDLKLLTMHSGWKVEFDKIYLQYPSKSIFGKIIKYYWSKFDYEGFYGVILSRDTTWSKEYGGWY